MSFKKENFNGKISDAENRKQYKEAFDEVHASGELLGKVLNMKKEQNNKIFRSIAKLGYAVVAGLIIGMVSTNAISYAQTGSTWIEKVIVSINGVKQEVDAVRSVDKDGNEQVQFTVEDESGNIYYEEIEKEDEAADHGEMSKLIEEDGRIYLLIDEDVAKIDVTEDIKDEKCEGTFEKDGETWKYELTGNLDEYQINITK